MLPYRFRLSYSLQDSTLCVCVLVRETESFERRAIRSVNRDMESNV